MAMRNLSCSLLQAFGLGLGPWVWRRWGSIDVQGVARDSCLRLEGRALASAAARRVVKPLESLSILSEEPQRALKIAVGCKDDVFLPPGLDYSKEKGLKKLLGSNIYIGHHAKDDKVKNAEFVRSSTKLAECPRDGLPEFALVGRSNVGKSSLLNALVQLKDLAGTSKTPGKTRVINHYLINKSWYLVDLPGYGYAIAPVQARTYWGAFTKDFFLRSQTLVSVLLLVDASIEPQRIDLDCIDWLGRNKVPVTIVFTKCDKRRKKKNGTSVEENVQNFIRLVKKSFNEVPPWIMTSSVTNQGRDDLLRHVAQLRDYWKN